MPLLNGAIAIAAILLNNLQQRQPSAVLQRWAVITTGWLAMMIFLNAGQLFLAGGLAGFALGLIALAWGTLSLGLLMSDVIGQRVRAVLPPEADFQPERPVHRLALILAGQQLTGIFATVISAGGVSGVAQNLDTTSVSPNLLLLNMLLYLLVAFLGVGGGLRREGPAMLQRLGLRWPTRQDVRAGLQMGVGLYGVYLVLAFVWVTLSSPEAFQEQTAASEAIFQALSQSLWLGFLVAATAAIGEEILFRGAIQPVFGLIPTSLFFVLMHVQYTLTPAALILTVVTFGFAFVRQRVSTAAAIVAHFVYNFIPFLLVALSGALATAPGWLL